MIIVETTFDSDNDARKFAKNLIEKRLGACVQITPITSFYHWNGDIEESIEYRCSIKTKKELFEDIENYILSIHKYEVPQILG